MRFSPLSLTTIFLLGAALPAAAATLSVPSKAYPTIQKAVNAAKPGDTVLVSAKAKGGVYHEAVTITTPGLILQGSNNPILDGTGLGVSVPQPPFEPITVYPNGIEIRANHVAVRGLTVQNTGGSPFSASSGINVGYTTADGLTNVGYSDIEISNVVARNNYTGITIQGYAGGSAFYGGTSVSLKGYCLSSDVVTGSSNGGVLITGASNVSVTGSRFAGNTGTGLTVGSNSYGTPVTDYALVTGNVFSGNDGDGLDAAGDGLLISTNEAATNTGAGVSVGAPVYNPALGSAQAPNPPASTVTLNTVHDNQSNGLIISGTQTVSGNLLSRNAGYGLFLSVADYSTVSLNLITGTTLTGRNYFDGTGLFADSVYNFNTGAYGGFLNITGNSISGSAGDGLYLAEITGSTLSRNDVSSNAGVGIHLSDFPTATDAPNTVTLNRALHNALFDARDDTTAPDTLVYPDGEVSFGDGGAFGPTVNIWTKNLFGTTDPVGLSK